MEKIKFLIKNNFKQWLSLFFVLVVFLGIAAYANFRSDNIHDPDSFYHIRHAQILRDNGIFNTEFPWTYFSVIRTLGADLWYGFHIFLIPFTYIPDLTLAIKVAGLVITFLVITSCYFAFKNLQIKVPFFWSLLFVFSAPHILYRLSMTRPHPLSLGLTALMFSFFYRGSVWMILILAFLLSWIHSSLFWMPFIAVAPIVLFKKLNFEKVGFEKILALFAGTAAGLMARPHPIANLKLIYIQVVELTLAKNHELAQIIGIELYPPSWIGLGWIILPLVAIPLTALMVLGYLIYKKEEFEKEAKILILSSSVMLLFSWLMYVNARRAIDILGFFTVTFGAITVSYYFSKMGSFDLNDLKKKLVVAVLGIILIFSVYGSYSPFEKDTNGASRRLRFMGPALWLRDNTKAGEIVFHPQWDQFPSLFFWNQHNYFTYGMDPVFLLKYDEKLYWKIYYIAVKDMAGLTCGVENCGPDDIELVYEFLTKDLKASYVFTRRVVDSRFLQYLESDKKHFEKVYDKELSVIFKVLPEKNGKKN